MKSAKNTIQRFALALLVGATLAVAQIDSAVSRDTDIYFTNPSATQVAVKPNIMVIIDTSGSMVNNNVSPGVTRLQAMKNAFNAILDDPLTQNLKMGLMRFSGADAGPVLFPVADLDACGIGSAPSCIENGAVTIETAAGSSSDDAEENKVSGVVSLTGSTLSIVTNGATEQVVGVRFPGVAVPRGTTITGAYIIFEANGTNAGGTPPVTIKAQNSSNPATFSTTNFDVSTRTNTSNAVSTSVTWNPVADWTANQKYATPDLRGIVQQLVNRSDWCGGGALFTFEGSGAPITRRAKSYDTGGTGDFAQGVPILVVQYDPTTIPSGSCQGKSLQVPVSNGNDDAEETLSSGSSNGTMDRNDNTLDVIQEGSSNQAVGIRFASVAVPPGATITSAFIDFTIDSSNSTTTNLSIVGQKTLTPGSFTTSKKNITSRVDTAAKKTSAVAWNSVPNPAANATLTTPDITTIVQELVNQTGWLNGNPMLMVITGSGSRQVKSRDSSSTLAPRLRITYQTTASASSVGTLTVRERLRQIVNGLQASGSTPITDSLWEAGLYFRGQNVLYGKQRGDGSGTDAQYTRLSHPASYTGGSGVARNPACTDANLNASECASEFIIGSPTYKSPFEDGCQNNYIVLLTDGQPTINNSVTLAETLTGSACATTTPSTGKCAAELAAYYKTNNLSGFSDPHTVSTDVIGFGSDVTSAAAVSYLTNIATAGGGSFYSAGDATSLVTAFQGILSNVNSAPTAFVSPSLSVNAFNKLFNRDEVYFSLFSPQLEIRWPGNVKRYKLCNDSTNATCNFGEILDANDVAAIDTTPDPVTGVPKSKIKTSATSVWSSVVDGPTIQLGGAGEKIPARALRKMYTYTGSSNTPVSAVDLTTTPINTTNVTKTMLGNSAMTDARRDDIINWILGKDVKDENGDSSTTDDRWKFADALHSRPLTISYGGTNADPIIKLLVGTNDGALRMINSKNGQEEWVVHIPEFLAVQGQLMDNPQNVHNGGVTGYPSVGLDGTPTAYVVDRNNNGVIDIIGAGNPLNDKIYLFIGERRGGRDIYAFDISPDSTLTDPNAVGSIKPKFLWRIKGGAGSFGALGQTWSRPILTTMRVKCSGTGCTTGSSTPKKVLMFAGGYDPQLDTPGTGNIYPPSADSMGNAIYIVDPDNGSLIWWAGGASSGANLELTNMQYSIPSDLAVLDTNGDGAVDRVYVGDTRGQLWRIDLGDQIDAASSGAGGSKGFVFANVVGSGRQHKRKFFYPPEVTQVTDENFSTVADYDLVVIGTGDREDPLDKLTSAVSSTEEPVHNRLYALRDYDIKTGPYAGSTPPATITEADLFDATSNDLTTLTGAALTLVKNGKGWMIKLKESTSPTWIGEKMLAKAVVFGGQLLFTTFVPPTNATIVSGTCSPLAEGTGRIFAVDYLSSAAIVDFNNDGSLERSYTVGGGIPSEAVIVIREGGVTALVGTSGGAANPDLDLSLPRYNTYWYEQ